MNRATRRAIKYNHQTGGTIFNNRAECGKKAKKPRKGKRVNLEDSRSPERHDPPR